MAIQLPNPGLGDGQTGDNEFVMWTKVKDNFSNQAHAASRLVGSDVGQLPVYTNAGLDGSGYNNKGGVLFQPDITVPSDGTDDEKAEAVRDAIYQSNLGSGFYLMPIVGGVVSPLIPSMLIKNATRFAWLAINHYSGIVEILHGNSTGRAKASKLYGTSNTTLENGYLKPSSPVLRLKHDDFKKEHEAEDLDIKVENPKKGVYKITGTTGLRKDDGWYFSPPKDEHFNILCMVEIEEEGDTITVKTYAKKFDFEKVAIVPDYDNPIDIIGEVILRFNDLPQEQLDEPIE